MSPKSPVFGLFRPQIAQKVLEITESGPIIAQLPYAAAKLPTEGEYCPKSSEIPRKPEVLPRKKPDFEPNFFVR